MRELGNLLISSLLPVLATGTACHSRHVDVTVHNRSGQAVRLLEVDYPSASFGEGSLGAGADFHYRIQLRGSGPLTVEYTANGQQVKVQGPTLDEGEDGQLECVLLPGGKAEFHPKLVPNGR